MGGLPQKGLLLLPLRKYIKTVRLGASGSLAAQGPRLLSLCPPALGCGDDKGTSSTLVWVLNKLARGEGWACVRQITRLHKTQRLLPIISRPSSPSSRLQLRLGGMPAPATGWHSRVRPPFLPESLKLHFSTPPGGARMDGGPRKSLQSPSRCCGGGGGREGSVLPVTSQGQKLPRSSSPLPLLCLQTWGGPRSQNRRRGW